MTTPSRKTIPAGLTALALTASLAGCNLSKTGNVPAGATDVVTVLPLVFGSATTLEWDQATLASLHSLGLTVAPEGTAVTQSQGPAGVDFPITTGYAEIHQDESKSPRGGSAAPPDQGPAYGVSPGWVQGSLYHQGSGLTITGTPGVAPFGSPTLPTAVPPPAPSVTLGDFVVDAGNSVLYATVDGQLPQVPLLSLDGSKLSVAATSPGTVGSTYSVVNQGNVTLSGTVARLTPQAVALLDARFPGAAISAGTELGTVTVAMTGEPVRFSAPADHVTAISRLTGEGTTLTLDPAASSALSGLGVTPTPTGAATATGDAVTFPITGGMVAVHADHGFNPGYVVGSVMHQTSGLSLSRPGGASLDLGDFVVDPGDGELYATVNGATNVPLLFLDGSHLSVGTSGGTVTLDGTVARLTNQAAAALDSTFATTAFAAGAVLGTVHLVATGRPGS